MTYIIIFIIILFFVFALSVILILSSVLPQQKKQKITFRRLNTIWESIVADNIKLSFVALFLALMIFIGVSIFSTNDWQEFINGIQVELFGILFDIIVLVLLFSWINSLGEKKRKIQRNLEEINDFRLWKGEEAKFRIRGNIKRLNLEGITKIDLSEIDISGNFTKGKAFLAFYPIHLDNSRLLESNLSNLNISNSTFNGITDHFSKFCYSGIINGEFRNAHLQSTDFSNAYLNGADFTQAIFTGRTNFNDAILLNVNFNEVQIDSANFEGAEVSADFLDKVKKWNIIGNEIFTEYSIVTHFLENNNYKYILRKKM